MTQLSAMEQPHINILKLSLPWILSALAVASLVVLLHLLKTTPQAPEDKVIVRKIDVSLPAPPPPPPPPSNARASESDSPSTSINLTGLGGGPQLSYADKPKMELPKSQSLALPEFTMDASTIQQRMALDMPLMAVEKLDQVPQVVKQKYFPPPLSIRKQGIKRISTEVELIIDQTGKPYIKRITDAVYPEMEDVIRKWVQHARFSIPKKDGRPVQAIYLYGIHFNYGT